MKEIIQIKRASFSNQTVNSTVKSIGRQKAVSEKKKKKFDLNSTSNNPKCSRGKNKVQQSKHSQAR